MNSVSELRLCDIASTAVFTVTPETPLEDAIRQFADEHVSSLVVVEDGKPVGIVTERDLLRLICIGASAGLLVRSVMSSPLVTARVDLDFSAAQVMMSNRAIRHLVLVDAAGNLTGVVSETDFRRHLGVDLFEAISSLNAVMEQSVELTPPEQSLASTLQAMSSRRLDHVIVGRNGRAEGILTERDVPRLMARQVDPASLAVGDVMVHPLRTIRVDTTVAEAARQMAETALRHLVVVDAAGTMVGVVSQHRMLERLGIVLMEENRSQLESRLNVVLEATGVGTWEFDHRGEILIRSLALNNVLGFPAAKVQETLGEVLLRVDPADREALARSFQKLKRGESDEFSLDYRVQDGDGALRWMTSRGRVVERDRDGKAVRSAGVAIDIEPQKIVEVQLRESEARFRGLTENIPLPLCHVNSRDELVFINHHFRETFGYTLEDVPDLATWWLRAYPDERYRAWVLDTWNEAVLVAADNRSIVRPIEYEVTCKNGDVRIVEISGITFGDDFLATFIDVTERRQQQALLEFSNAILNHISIDAPLPKVLDFITLKIEAQEPAMRCSVLLLDTIGKHLRHGAAPSLPADYSAAIDGVEIGPAVGSCGTAAYLGEAVFAGDIATDPCWADYKELALGHGLAACWSSPIFSAAGRVLGTFAAYWAAPQPVVDPVARRYVEAATRLAAIAIENAQRDARLRTIQQGLLRAEELGHLGSWTFNRLSREVVWSDQMFVLFNRDPAAGVPDFESFLQLVHPADRPLVVEARNRMQSGEAAPEITYRRHPSLGPACFLQASFSLVRDANGRMSGFEGTLLDVTPAKQAEERLRGQLDELRRWQKVTLGREGRVLELKHEVNTLLARLGEVPRYGSVLDAGGKT